MNIMDRGQTYMHHINDKKEGDLNTSTTTNYTMSGEKWNQ